MVFHDLSENPNLETKTSGEYKIASVNDRLLAFVIDALILSPILGILFARPLRDLKMLFFLSPKSSELIDLLWVVICGGMMAIILLLSLSQLLISATPGQLFLRIRLVSLAPHQPRLRLSQLLLRHGLWLISFLPLGVPFLEIYINPRRRAFYDRAADTLLVTTKAKSDPGPHPMEARVFSAMLGGFFLMLFLAVTNEVGNLYQSSLQGTDKQAEMIANNDLCSDVPADLTSIERLDQAVALFLASRISSDCLAREADFAFWTLEVRSKSWAYLAKGLASDHDPARREKYLSKACQMDESSNACDLALAIQDEKAARDQTMAQAVWNLNLLSKAGDASEVQSLLAKAKFEGPLKEYSQEMMIEILSNQRAPASVSCPEPGFERSASEKMPEADVTIEPATVGVPQ